LSANIRPAYPVNVRPLSPLYRPNINIGSLTDRRRSGTSIKPNEPRTSDAQARNTGVHHRPREWRIQLVHCRRSDRCHPHFVQPRRPSLARRLPYSTRDYGFQLDRDSVQGVREHRHVHALSYQRALVWWDGSGAVGEC